MKRDTFIYFVKPVGLDGPIKIGCSAKPPSRLKVLSAWSPFALELIGAVPGKFSDETYIHRRFSDLHMRKEWFMSSPLLRVTIDKILDGVPIRTACEKIPEKTPIRNQKRPAETEDRARFRRYGREIKKAAWHKRDTGRIDPPHDVSSIMHNWRCDRTHDHEPVTPNPEQIARLDAFIADPTGIGTFVPWKPFVPKAAA